jgi:hypothetical protein
MEHHCSIGRIASKHRWSQLLAAFGSLLLTPSITLAAQSVRIVDEKATTTETPYSVSAAFNVNHENKELKRAWVEVEVKGGYVDMNLHREIVLIKKNVPGLYYKPETNEVVYQPEGVAQAVVCGTYLPGNFLNWASVRLSGHCNFSTKIEKRPSDNGYTTRQEPFITVDMNVQGESQ